MAQDVKSYVIGCVKCQKFINYNYGKLTNPEVLEMPECRWGSLAKYFILGLA